MDGSTNKPDALAAYRELESITTCLLAACERGEIDAIVAEIGRREEIQQRLQALEEGDITPVRDDILAILGRVREMDEKIEPKMFDMMAEIGTKIRSAVNSRKLLDSYMKEPDDSDAKFYDRRG